MADEEITEYENEYSVAGAMLLCTLIMMGTILLIFFYGEPDLLQALITNLQGSCGTQTIQ